MFVLRKSSNRVRKGFLQNVRGIHARSNSSIQSHVDERTKSHTIPFEQFGQWQNRFGPVGMFFGMIRGRLVHPTIVTALARVMRQLLSQQI